MTAKDFLLQLPEKLNTNVLAGLETTFHFEMEGENEGNVTISFANGKMISSDGLIGEPSCVIKAKGDDFKKLIKGELNPMLAILTGKLKISNQGEMLKFAKLLGWM